MPLVLLESYDQVIHAEMAKSYLESYGIECQIHDGHIVSTQWLYANIVGGVKLKVYQEDFEKAKGYLRDLPNELEEDEFQGPECPQCSSTQTEAKERKNLLRRLTFLSWIILPGFALPLSQSTDWICSNCDHNWTTKEKPGSLAVIGQFVLSMTLFFIGYYIYSKFF